MESKNNTQLVVCDFYQVAVINGSVDLGMKKLISSKHLIQRKYVNDINANVSKGFRYYVIDEDATQAYYDNIASERAIDLEAKTIIAEKEKEVQAIFEEVREKRAYNKKN